MADSSRLMIRQNRWLYVGLIVATFSLVFQLTVPALVRWWHSPSSGDIGIDYLNADFLSMRSKTCLSPAFLAFLPQSYGEHRLWPLVLFLHGSGDRGSDPTELMRFTKHLSSVINAHNSAIILAPQCQAGCRWLNDDIQALVKTFCETYQVDNNRVYALGYSTGGYGVWGTAAAYPDLFAATVPIAGGGEVGNASRLTQVPTWVFHGAKDKVVPPERSIQVIDAIRRLGGEPKFTLYPEKGHGIIQKVCRTPELWAWLLEQDLSKRVTQKSTPEKGSKSIE